VPISNCSWPQLKGRGIQVKLSRGRGEVRQAAALLTVALSRIDGVEPGPLGGVQRRLMQEVAGHAAAYSVIAALESEAAGDQEDEDLAEGVEVSASRLSSCYLRFSPLHFVVRLVQRTTN
jgi:hypothetical protein